MKIDKAIEIQAHLMDKDRVVTVKECTDALKLGIEAMKGITAIRCGAISNVNKPLPGETRE